MTDAAALALAAGRHLDLVTAPFTMPRSRLLVFREGDGVRVHTSEYERGLDECRVLDELDVRDANGARLCPIVDVQPHRILFGGRTAVDSPAVRRSAPVDARSAPVAKLSGNARKATEIATGAERP